MKSALLSLCALGVAAQARAAFITEFVFQGPGIVSHVKGDYGFYHGGERIYISAGFFFHHPFIDADSTGSYVLTSNGDDSYDGEFYWDNFGSLPNGVLSINLDRGQVTSFEFDPVFCTYECVFMTQSKFRYLEIVPDSDPLSYEDVGGSWRLNGTFGPIPEPATWTLAIAGFGAVGIALRKKRQAVRA